MTDLEIAQAAKPEKIKYIDWEVAQRAFVSADKSTEISFCWLFLVSLFSRLLQKM